MTELPLRAGTLDDWPAISRLMATAFHENWDEEVDRVERGVFEPTRSLVAADGDTVVGHAAAFTRRLSVPGAVLPAAHVSLVGVLPTHRRRRLLTRLMHRQLREVDEPLAVLWASEAAIYPRFGYGMAAGRLAFSVEAGTRLPEPGRPGRLRMAAPGAVRADLAAVHEEVRGHRPGWSDRPAAWWDHVLSDPPARRDGATELRAVVHRAVGPDGARDHDRPDGYALWRVRTGWDHGPESEVMVKEVVAADLDAYLALWRFLTSIDLTRRCVVRLGATEEPLLHLVAEPRRMGATLADGLFVRLVDVRAALAGRRYALPVDLVVEVTDAVLPANAGRWHLVGDRDGADCRPSTAPADLTCDVADLGAAYLGGTPLTALAAAGRVHARTPAVLAAANAGFGWHPAPAGLELF